MKSKYIGMYAALLLALFGAGSMRGDSSLLVEEGRTWWYSYWCLSMDDGEIGEFGLKLAGSEELDGTEWQKCVVVSESGSPMLSFPIAWLRQEGDKVYVLPHTTTEPEWEEIEKVPDFFSSVYDKFLMGVFSWQAEEWVKGEQLLYDWAIKSGEKIEYPWIFRLEPGEYENISITDCETIDDRTIWKGNWGYHGSEKIQIVEGIGAVSSGTFLYPCSYVDMKVGMPIYPEEVHFEKVTDKDGKLIYHVGAEEPSYPLMVTVSKVWNYTDVYGDTEGTRYYDNPGFHFGDEQKEMNGKTYSPFLDGEGRLYAYLRQEGPKVYIAGENVEIFNPFTLEPVEQQDEYLLYDFSLEAGERFETVGFDYVGWPEGGVLEGVLLQAEVLRTYEKEVMGVTYRYQEYNRFSSDTELPYGGDKALVTVIEGIGPMTGYVCFPGAELREMTGMGGWNLTCLTSVTTKDGEILWDDPSGVETVGADTVSSGGGAIYDLYGRRVAEPLPGSVYIRDGRKYVAR